MIVLPDREQDGSPLSQSEEAKLITLEDAIQQGFHVFVDTDSTLATIRDSGRPSQCFASVRNGVTRHSR